MFAPVRSLPPFLGTGSYLNVVKQQETTGFMNKYVKTEHNITYLHHVHVWHF